MMIPTIHLNGTGKETLLAEIAAAVDAISAAIAAVGHMTVHGRDYYPQGPLAYSVARIQQDDRLNALRAVMDELVEMYNKIEGGA